MLDKNTLQLIKTLNPLEKTASVKERLEKVASSRVKSPDAFYQAAPPAQPVPLQGMDVGNSEILQQQAQQVAQLNRQRKQEQQAMQPPPPDPSIQGNTAITRPPFPPKYTGM